MTTIRINNIQDVHVGDMLFVKGRSDGFRVTCVRPVGVDNPFCYGTAYVSMDRFVYAERTVEEPEWPEPEGLTPHLYLGADGKRYAYVPDTEDDTAPWRYQVDCETDWTCAEWLVEHRPEALPLREFTAPEEEA